MWPLLLGPSSCHLVYHPCTDEEMKPRGWTTVHQGLSATPWGIQANLGSFLLREMGDGSEHKPVYMPPEVKHFIGDHFFNCWDSLIRLVSLLLLLISTIFKMLLLLISTHFQMRIIKIHTNFIFKPEHVIWHHLYYMRCHIPFTLYPLDRLAQSRHQWCDVLDVALQRKDGLDGWNLKVKWTEIQIQAPFLLDGQTWVRQKACLISVFSSTTEIIMIKCHLASMAQ